MEIKVIPGILEKDFEEIKKKVSLVSPYVDTIQIDLCDGKLVSNKTFDDPEQFKEIIKNEEFELHLMVSEPGEIVDGWIDAGFKKIIGHIEGIAEPMDFLLELKKKGVAVGLGIDFDTKVSILEDYLDYIDFVLVMTVRAGFSGQDLIESALEKVKWLRNKRPNLDIEVDGGINPATGKMALEAGANVLISNSYIFSGDVKENIEKLKT